MEADPEECFFNWKFKCQHKKEPFIAAKAVRITNIIRCSKLYGDDKHFELQNALDKNTEITLKCHKSCVSSYTSKSHTERHKRQSDDQTEVTPHKVTRRSLSTETGKTFKFREHCVFCAEECILEKDKKNPSRWRAAFLFREIDKKQYILEFCEKRNDNAAESVRRRVEAALSDLHAEDARYHLDCRKRFFSSRSLPGETVIRKGNAENSADPALESVATLLSNDRSRMWNSVELFEAYIDFGGDKTLSRKTLVSKLQVRFGNDLLVLSSPGIANIIALRSFAAQTLRLVKDEEDEVEMIATRASKQIVQEVTSINMDKKHYDININTNIVKESISEFLLLLLSKVSPKLDNTLPALLIGSIITSVVKNHATSLQVDIAGKMGESKKLINSLYSYKVTCSYSEFRRFKKSCACAAVEDIKLSGISNADHGLVQVIVDNFDADISSQNGKQSTHSLAVLLTQSQTVEEETPKNDKIKRIHKDDMSKEIPYDVNIHRYQGVKQPEMPQEGATKAVLSLKALAHQAIKMKRASEMDFRFMQDVLRNEDCPEFHGYNTKESRGQGHKEDVKTRAVYEPLIDMKPSDPDTMMTAMVRAQELTFATGQRFTILSCDQQLYRVAVQVLWAHPDKFNEMYLRLGGMHALMSFVGAIGTLMDESGLSDILKEVFGGVQKMLSGKKFPQNVRALRLLAEECLRSIITDGEFEKADDLMKALEERATQSKTAKLWVDVLIKPVFLMMSYIRAEREGDWLLHLATFKQMLPYYFASSHVHYARYGLYYLRTMEKLPPHVLSHFLKGEHVTRHVQGIWNGIWSDQFIESTFMRYGHGSGGIIGITLKEETLKVWALSRHLCCKIESELEEMEEGETSHISHLCHKEEGKARIQADGKDRAGIRQKLEAYIDPLDPKEHPDGIVNIASGRVAISAVNVYDAVSIGETMLASFEKDLPSGFYNTISKQVTTMAAVDTSKQVDTKAYDLNSIYARVIALLASDRDVDIKDVLSYELAPVPSSMFKNDGMRIAKGKSALKNSLQVEVSIRNAGDADVTVIDGSALLWTIHWPADGTVADYVANFKKRVASYLVKSDVYLIFDRYNEYSTKSVTRDGRESGVSRRHHLALTTRLPAQKVVLSNVENKKQLIRIICSDLTEDALFHNRSTEKNKLVVTGEDPCPTEIKNEDISIRYDLETHHEEADIIIVQQALKGASEARRVAVVSDDTDVFVLLVHHYEEAKLNLPMTMESPSKGRAVIDIQQTVKKHRNIVKHILPAHAISGCDTVACCFGIGKVSVVKTLRAGYKLNAVGIVDASFNDVIDQATTFMSACYGVKDATDMSQTRLVVWGAKNGKGYTSAPNLSALPPTREAFAENMKRAHYQAILWRTLDTKDLPELNTEDYGWKKDISNKSLTPSAIPDGVKLAPDYIMEMIRCGCKSKNPCSSKRCSCTAGHGSKCTIFCACYSIGCARVK